MPYEFIKIDKSERVAILKLNRPKALNALNTQVLKELDLAIDQLDKDESVDVIIITGEGKAFVAGADITEMKDLNAEEGRRFGNFGQKVFRKIEKMEKPVIAAVNGFALGGGCELAMCCDMRIASEKAKFGQPEVGLGIVPGFSGTQRLPRLVGIGKAKELIFTGDIIKAEEAEKIGLVNKVVAHEELMNEAMDLAKRIVKNAQKAVRYANIAINRGIETDIETGIEIEADLFGLCFATKDQKEGMTAFVEKRKAEFKGE
ncbi:short-chain-enoyl-CoA hydratase [Crassaminicella thermophila]|uniref:short-chain-enoyl-CoA hydratase n=1 Tax=Crassaminicella thermophila TaxID=2599308 RepID=A0A5C0SAT1_CRATE|nr:short-chain-enoyl-CoA hydratase [Crassaminicella thermophila]QEK11062.1 short-chain-enoyl-CoA hydratase [Crassaminicella thermophila]